ncbi:MAG TPA: TonB-dependent receptor [Rhizomicrobium sp.]|jgi:iron complex outermembrane receptor protein
MSIFHRAHAGVLLILFCAGSAYAAPLPDNKPLKPGQVETVEVTGARTSIGQPNSIERVTAAKARQQVNAVNPEDLLKYTPSLVVRKRHYGDTQDPVATRTSGVGSSARTLIYVDDILISSPIGNNNTTASPHFGVIAPEDVSAIDVLYGPFTAEYAGNSIGAVLNIITRMPDHFEVHADALGAVQDFSQYGTHRNFGTAQLGVGIGDRDGAFSWRLSTNHLDSTGQPLTDITLTPPATPSGGGTAVSGAFNGLNRTAMPIAIIGVGGIEHQIEDTGMLKLAYDFANRAQLSYTASLFHQSDDATAQTYLRDASGVPVYSGSVNIGGYNYVIGATSFSNNIYDWKQTHLAQALALRSTSGDNFAWEIVGTDYVYLNDSQRVPATALPAKAGGAGTINRLNGTGWYTFDAKGVWQGWEDHELSFGIHRDAETFRQSKFSTADWLDGGPASLAARATGKTGTDAIWLQDIWSFAPDFKATLGGRYEDWRAHDGANFSAAPPLNVQQPVLSHGYFSPKASVAWQPQEPWTISASWGSAYRMPTVTELYQAITTGPQLTVPNPDLKPEHANSYELAAEHAGEDGRVRLSFFQEDITHALLSQTAPLLPGSNTLFSFVQNVDHTRVRGIEFVADRNDVLFDGLELSGSLTFADGRVVKDTVFAKATNKFIPQLPKWRANIVATYRPGDRLAFTLAARTSARAFGTIDNSDTVSQTFQGFGAYFVVDARGQYRVDDHWTASIGIDNLNNDKYFLYHPFPQRTFLMEIHYAR